MFRSLAVFSLLLLFVLGSHAQSTPDACLDNAVAVRLVNKALTLDLTEPRTDEEVVNLIANLAAIVNASSSPYTINVGAGYADDAYFTVQSCQIANPVCNQISSGLFTQFQTAATEPYLRTYEVPLDNFRINLSAIVTTDTAQYHPTQRPWYNANGWSPSYAFVNLPITGRSYEITQASTGAHVISDRIAYEPCDRCLTTSPSVGAATYLASNAALDSMKNLGSLVQAESALSVLLTQFLIPNQFDLASSSMGVGFSNGDFYFVSDCLALPARNSTAECDNGNRYFGEIGNVRIFGDMDLHAVQLSASGIPLDSPRDEGTPYDPRVRPWYVLGAGWTDPYSFTTGAGITTARTFAATINGGVVLVDSNPANPCPAYEEPETCPDCPTNNCCNNNNNNGYGNHGKSRAETEINFFFADMLRQ